MTTYVVAPPTSGDYVFWLLSLVLFAALVLVIVVALAPRMRSSRAYRNKVVAVLAVVIVLVASGFFDLDPFAGNTVAVSQEALTMSAPALFSVTLNADQVKEAFVVNLSTWNVGISGASGGDKGSELNIGAYPLSNGASADVISDEQLNLVVVASSGQYFILGPSDFQAFVADFSAHVAPVTNATP